MRTFWDFSVSQNLYRYLGPFFFFAEVRVSRIGRFNFAHRCGGCSRGEHRAGDMLPPIHRLREQFATVCCVRGKGWGTQGACERDGCRDDRRPK